MNKKIKIILYSTCLITVCLIIFLTYYNKNVGTNFFKIEIFNKNFNLYILKSEVYMCNNSFYSPNCLTKTDIDPNSFSIIGTSTDLAYLARDKNSFIVFPSGRRITDLSSNTSHIGYHYFKDNNKIYRYDGSNFQEMKDLESKNVQPISENYISIENTVFLELSPYQNSVELVGSDAKTFVEYATMSEMFISKDKNHVYSKGSIIDSLNPTTFKLFSTGSWGTGASFGIYYGDDKNIYFNNKKIEKADARSFKYIASDYARDRNYFYDKGEIVSNNPDKTEKEYSDKGYFNVYKD